MDHLQSCLKVSCAQRSQAGKKSVNEDSMGIRIPEGAALTHKGVVAVVAEGLGSDVIFHLATQSRILAWADSALTLGQLWDVFGLRPHLDQLCAVVCPTLGQFHFGALLWGHDLNEGSTRTSHLDEVPASADRSDS